MANSQKQDLKVYDWENSYACHNMLCVCKYWSPNESQSRDYISRHCLFKRSGCKSNCITYCKILILAFKTYVRACMPASGSVREQIILVGTGLQTGSE